MRLCRSGGSSCCARRRIRLLVVVLLLAPSRGASSGARRMIRLLVFRTVLLLVRDEVSIGIRVVVLLPFAAARSREELSVEEVPFSEDCDGRDGILWAGPFFVCIFATSVEFLANLRLGFVKDVKEE
eukprot:442674-Rhodomonas_salina.1